MANEKAAPRTVTVTNLITTQDFVWFGVGSPSPGRGYHFSREGGWNIEREGNTFHITKVVAPFPKHPEFKIGMACVAGWVEEGMTTAQQIADAQAKQAAEKAPSAKVSISKNDSDDGEAELEAARRRAAR